MDKSSIIILAVAVLVVIVWTGYMYSKKRSDAFHELATRRGLSFTERADIAIDDGYPEFLLFRQGMSHSVRNIMRGTADNARIMLFDYQYRTGAGSGQMSMTHDMTVLILESEKLDLPSFQIYPENQLYVISKVLGRQDINFPHHPEFSNLYVLRGEDEGAVRNVFHDTVRSYFASRKGWSVEGRGRKLLFYRNGVVVKTEELTKFLSEGMEVLRLFENASSAVG